MSRNESEGIYVGYSKKYNKHVRVRRIFVEPMITKVETGWADLIMFARINTPEHLKPLPPSNYKF
jgi:hypothetical protein